jgi:C4-dicarboxylate transporter, DctQ subunit
LGQAGADADMQQQEQGQGQGGGVLALCANIAGGIADVLGHVASFVLVLLTLGIVLGITLRWVGIDNSWTYDFDLFMLVWTAFAGAAYTSLRGRHVTAGIAIENVIGRGTLLGLLRFVIVVGFLVLFAISGIWDTLSSYQTNETTIDVDQWPVWIAKAALPIGISIWAVAELAKFLRQVAGLPPTVHESLLDE